MSCWNAKTIGIEMVGNYEIGGDEFASGLGTKVRDNAAAVPDVATTSDTRKAPRRRCALRNSRAGVPPDLEIEAILRGL